MNIRIFSRGRESNSTTSRSHRDIRKANDFCLGRGGGDEVNWRTKIKLGSQWNGNSESNLAAGFCDDKFSIKIGWPHILLTVIRLALVLSFDWLRYLDFRTFIIFFLLFFPPLFLLSMKREECLQLLSFTPFLLFSWRTLYL